MPKIWNWLELKDDIRLVCESYYDEYDDFPGAGDAAVRVLAWLDELDAPTYDGVTVAALDVDDDDTEWDDTIGQAGSY